MDRSAVRVRARALLPHACDRNGLLDQHRLLEVVKALLASNVAHKRDIARELGVQAEQLQRQQVAVVTSAAPLAKNVQEEIASSLQRAHTHFKAVDWQIDIKLLGGFTVQIGDTWYDFTIANDLHTLREQLSR